MWTRLANWLPFPPYVAVIMLLVGAAVGFAVGWSLTCGAPSPPPENAPATLSEGRPNDVPQPKEPSSPSEKKPLFLHELPAGPVQRALTQAVQQIRPKLEACQARVKEKNPQAAHDLLLRLSFETTGKLAKVTAFPIEPKAAVEIMEPCLKKALDQGVVDLAADNGAYEILLSLP